MFLCPQCFLQGYCRTLRARLITDEELSSPFFLSDVRSYAYRLDISCDVWPGFLTDAYRDYPGTIRNAQGRPVDLDTEVLDAPSIRYWFRDTCKPVVGNAVPRLRIEARERFRVVATILRARDPAGTRLWGVRAANDEEPQSFAPARLGTSGCPYSGPSGTRTLIKLGR